MFLIALVATCQALIETQSTYSCRVASIAKKIIIFLQLVYRWGLAPEVLQRKKIQKYLSVHRALILTRSRKSSDL